MDNKKLLSISIIILAMSIIFGSIWVGKSLEKNLSLKNSVLTSTSTLADNKVLTLSQVAQYLNMTEKEVNGIIETEERILSKSGVFSGRMFPYFTIDKKHYFYKDEIEEWLKEVSRHRRQYNTIEGWIL